MVNANPFQMHAQAHTSAVIIIPDNSSCSDELDTKTAFDWAKNNKEEWTLLYILNVKN